MPPRAAVRPRRSRPWSCSARLGAFVALVVSFCAPLPAQISSPAPVRNFTLPFFNDEGFHTMLVRGREASLANPQRIGLSDMTLTLFSGDETQKVDTVILSPTATVIPADSRIVGPGQVRLIRDDLELTGEEWSYDQPAKRILIQRGARIVFHAALADLLK